MTDLQERIDRVMELDKCRTPGKEWEFLEEHYGHDIGLYIKDTEIRILDMGDNTEYYTNCGAINNPSDENFILAAPEMVSIIKELTDREAKFIALIRTFIKLTEPKKGTNDPDSLKAIRSIIYKDSQEIFKSLGIEGENK